MNNQPKKWTREWAVRRLIERTRDLLRFSEKNTKEYFIQEGRVRELMDILEER